MPFVYCPFVQVGRITRPDDGAQPDTAHLGRRWRRKQSRADGPVIIVRRRRGLGQVEPGAWRGLPGGEVLLQRAAPHRRAEQRHVARQRLYGSGSGVSSTPATWISGSRAVVSPVGQAFRQQLTARTPAR